MTRFFKVEFSFSSLILHLKANDFNHAEKIALENDWINQIPKPVDYSITITELHFIGTKK